MANPASILREAHAGWLRHHTAHLAAALAFYLAFSLAPLLVIAISAAGLILGPKAATQDVLGPVRDVLGPSGARFVSGLIANLNRPASNIVAGAIGALALTFGASGAFTQLHDALNIIFETKPSSLGFGYAVRVRSVSFLIAALIGAVLLASQVFDASLLAYAAHAHTAGSSIGFGPRALIVVISFVVIAELFTLLFRFVPQADMEWRDAAVGGALTALLFLFGQWLLSAYVRYATFHSVHGAAAAALIVMSWLYYLALIVLFGAEFTRAYAFARRQTALPGVAG